jgi:hypothetical protein
MNIFKRHTASFILLILYFLSWGWLLFNTQNAASGLQSIFNGFSQLTSAILILLFISLICLLVFVLGITVSKTQYKIDYFIFLLITILPWVFIFLKHFFK